MVREEGVKGLYKGMLPCFLKVVPSMAISFTVYEQLRKYLEFDPPSSKPPSAG
jgi:solute carrier family 25 phosphate transporter 23/24/25/41